MLEKLLSELPTVTEAHKRGSSSYNTLYNELKDYVDNHYSYSGGEDTAISFGDIALTLPFFEMGNCNTTNLFDLDEIILFSFYHNNRDRYSSAVDIGANLGLHSIFMDKCGFSVDCYEPDEFHYSELLANLELNACSNVNPIMAAVSDSTGEASFIRILNNTTSSHLKGSKDNVYGPTEEFNVVTIDINKAVEDADLVKIDAEGHENTILEAISSDQFDHLDMVLEVSSPESAQIIFDRFASNCNILSQKLNWGAIRSVEDIPVSYKEGSLFISRRFDSFYGN
jgi:FkbM family methyltransferase|tara:strand:- start:639 stop:1487 length:849 start_codon:yes stop_codon:yes gene_type:complete